MEEWTQSPRERIEELTAAMDKLQEQVREQTISNLCRLIIEEKETKTEDPGPKPRPQNPASPPGDVPESGAMLGLQLLCLQAELDLLTLEPQAPWGPIVACMRQIVGLTANTGLFYRPDRRCIAVAGWLMLGCCMEKSQEALLMRCMPMGYSLVVQQIGEQEAKDRQAMKKLLFLFPRLIRSCVAWGLQQEGAQILALFDPAFAEALGQTEAASFYVRLLLESGDLGGSEMVTAYGDVFAPEVAEHWDRTNKEDFFWGYGFALYKTSRTEDSMAAFDRCYTLRRQSFGPDHLLTLLPRAFYWFERLIVHCRDYDEAGAAFLVDFLEKALGHAYDNVVNYDQLLRLVGGLTFSTLGRMARLDKGELVKPLMERYIRTCERYDQDPTQPTFRKRYALGLSGVLESTRNNGNQALEYTLRALETPILPTDEPLLDDDTLEYNAGYLCCLMGAIPEGLTRLATLLDRLMETEDSNEEIFLRTLAAYCSCLLLTDDLDMEEMTDLRAILQEGAQDLCAGDDPLDREEDKLELAAYSAILELMYSTGNLPPEDFPAYTRMIRAGLRRMGENTLFAALRTVLVYQLMMLLWLQDDREALSLADVCEQQMGITPLSYRMRASCALLITLVRHRYGDPGAAVPSARNQLRELENQWKNSVRTLDDSSLALSMVNARTVFGTAYCILREQLSTEESFSLILQFKALASLAARERNRILLEMRDDQVNQDLEELHRLQNRRTVLYTLPEPDGEQMDRIERELSRLSARIEKAMPDSGRFTPLSVQALAEKLPADSAVVEYYWAVDLDRRNFLDYGANDRPCELDLYLLRRRESRVVLKRRTLGKTAIPDLQQQCEAFRQCCRDADTYGDRSARARKNDLRRRLYQTLIQPVEDLLEGVRTLYLAPEEWLRDIPYGLLGLEESRTLESRFTVIQMICSRDLLFAESGGDQGGACVVGDPDYLARSREPRQEQEERGTDRGRTGELYPLPFSRTEAELVARYTGGTCLVGSRATKQAVEQQAGQYGILHIAAHGDFDDQEDAGLFRARIYMAGAQTFLDTSRTDPTYGNGILTANEISRMNLHHTWLAVLSACFSGMGQGNLAGGIHGMVSAFGAAGVRYVVSSLWEADDFATAELMRCLYRELSRGTNVPEALRLAKASVARVTVGELRRAGWEAVRCSPDTPPQMREVLDLRLGRAEGFRPFADEHYWGGFVCHRCR